MRTTQPSKQKNPLRKLLIVCGVAALIVGFIFLFPDLRYSGKRDAYSQVDLEHLLHCANLANSSYHEPQTIRNEFGPHIEVMDFPNSGIRVMLDIKPDKNSVQWIVLRGTTNLPNVFADLDFVERKNHELEVHVHRGFDNALQECLPWVITRIQKDRPVCITGHSLGGSVAVLMAGILERRGYRKISAVTFGQPKVTDEHGAKSLNKLDVIRVVFDDDPIPLIPPNTIAEYQQKIYHHFGGEVILRRNGHFYYTDNHDPERSSAADFWSTLSHIHPESHILGNSYLPALEAALARAK